MFETLRYTILHCRGIDALNASCILLVTTFGPVEWQAIGFVLLLVAGSIIGSIARLTTDHQEEEIPKQAWIRYLICGFASSIILCSVVYHYYDTAPFLLALSVAGGFSFVNVLTLLSTLLERGMKVFASKFFSDHKKS